MPKAESMCKMYLEPSDLSTDPHPRPRPPPRRTVRPFKSPLQPLAGGRGSRGFHSQQELEPQVPSTPPPPAAPSPQLPGSRGSSRGLCSVCAPSWDHLPGRVAFAQRTHKSKIAWGPGCPVTGSPSLGTGGSTRPEGKQPSARGRARARCGTGTSEKE